jgi:hypothetical protein
MARITRPQGAEQAGARVGKKETPILVPLELESLVCHQKPQ